MIKIKNDLFWKQYRSKYMRIVREKNKEETFTYYAANKKKEYKD